MNTELNVMMLAAGLGTRLKPLTLTYPKPCVPFLNVPLGLFQFQYLKYLEIAKLVVNTHHLSEKVQRLYQTQPFFRRQIFFSDESEKILGGAGGFKKASPLMKKDLPVLLMNADEVYFAEDKAFLQKAFYEHIQNKNLATVVVIEHPEAGKKFGALWCENRIVKDISKTARHENLKPWHCIGPIFLSWEVLNLINENEESNIFYDVLIHQLAQQKVQIYPIKADWYETGNPTDYFLATEDVLKNLDQDTIDFINDYDKSDFIRNDKTISLISKKQVVPKELLTGFNVISKSAQIKPTEKISNSVLFDDLTLNKKYFNL